MLITNLLIILYRGIRKLKRKGIKVKLKFTIDEVLASIIIVTLCLFPLVNTTLAIFTFVQLNEFVDIYVDLMMGDLK